MKLSGKVRFIVALVSVVAVILAGGILPWPQHAVRGHMATVHADGGCSLATLNGPYAVARQGTLVSSVLGLPAPAPWGEVALADFDGGGRFSFTANVNIGGVAISGGGTGTYTVSSDCTGSVIVHPNPPFNTIVVTEAIVVIRGGQQYVATDTDSFTLVQGRGERLGD